MKKSFLRIETSMCFGEFEFFSFLIQNNYIAFA